MSELIYVEKLIFSMRPFCSLLFIFYIGESNDD